MNKYLHTFESYNNLDMPINPSFSSYPQYKPYMSDYDVGNLVNRLNNMWWDMEQEDPADEVRMNEIGQELDELEEEIKERIRQIETETAEEDENDNSYLSDLVEDFKHYMHIAGMPVNILSEDYSPTEVNLLVDIDGEEYDITIDEENNIFLTDSDITAYMGKLHSYDEKPFTAYFKELLNSFGEDYIEFLKNNAVAN